MNRSKPTTSARVSTAQAGSPMRTSIAILGDGAWGTAIALLLAQNPRHRVTLWSARAENGRLLQERRENVRLLPGVPSRRASQLTTDIRRGRRRRRLVDRRDPDRVSACHPGAHRPGCRPRPPVLSLAKGLEIATFLRPSEILTQVLGVEQVAVLSGPSHAEEVSRGLPTSVVVGQPRSGTGPLDSAAVQHRSLSRLHEPRSDRRRAGRGA